MHKRTRNSAIGLAVMLTGCILSLMGRLLEPTQTLFVAGLTMTNAGLLQSYYGTVLEIEQQKRFWYFVLSVPLTLAFVYLSSLSLGDYLSAWYVILAVVILVLGLQFAVTLMAAKIWSNRHRCVP